MLFIRWGVIEEFQVKDKESPLFLVWRFDPPGIDRSWRFDKQDCDRFGLESICEEFEVLFNIE